MNAPRSLLEQQLAPAERVLDALAPTTRARFDVLEALASELGGSSLSALRAATHAEHALTIDAALDGARAVAAPLAACGIPPALALSALTRPRIPSAEQRASGAYHTDHRLARAVAEAVEPALVAGARIIDPAAGSGMLLVAATLVATKGDRRSAARWLAESVTAWDRSAEALRGAALALAACTDDVAVLPEMLARWRCHDSLLTPLESAAEAFDVVVANPPWEKLKLTRHEHAKASGATQSYGEEPEGFDAEELSASRASLGGYSGRLSARFGRLGAGETDLYRAFLELFLELTRPGGRISALVPAGLARAQGTAALRRHLFASSRALSLTVLDNRARFFAIDTRFRFLALHVEKLGGLDDRDRAPVRLARASGTADAVVTACAVELTRAQLTALSAELTIPDLSSAAEWSLFERMNKAAAGSSVARPPEPELVRELDMTRDRGRFVHTPGEGHLPLVEGRMVHQHRFGAKVHRAGTGRSASWTPQPLGESAIGPQFWVPESRLSSAVRTRVSRLRAGFCDITSQTNERSLLAALIPPGVVCGNKVPTVTFPDDPSDTPLLTWVAVANSLAFDWALRRIVTTTVNFFVLRSVPWPALDAGAEARITAASRALWDADRGVAPHTAWAIAELRASIDVEVASGYGLDLDDLALVFDDFPLLDRGQPPLDGEARSTITRDLVTSIAAVRFGGGDGGAAERVARARALGAVAYVPEELARLSKPVVTPRAKRAGTTRVSRAP